MAKYQEFDAVILKDGRHGSIVEVYGPGAYEVDVGHSPKDWDSIFATDDDIARLAAPEENAESAAESERQLREQGLWEA